MKANKRKSWRLLSTILVLCLCITSIPGIAFATDETKDVDKKTQGQEVTYLDPEEVTEEDASLEESGEDYTTFNLGGKKRCSVFYTENVRYQDESGNLTDYDPSLIDTTSSTKIANSELTGYAYHNRKGNSKHYIPEQLSEETPLLLKKDDYSLAMAPTEKTHKDFFGKKVKAKKEKDKVLDAYGKTKEKNIKAVFKDTTALAYLEYVSLNTGVKENIVLTKRPAKNIMQFEIIAKGMSPKVHEGDGSIGFYDSADKMVSIINSPNMNDASGNAYSEALSYAIEKKQGENDTFILTLTIDKDYLKSKDRQYPVTIDPTQTWVGNDNARDVSVSSASKTTNYYGTSRQTMPVGKGSTSTYRTFIKFFDLGTAINGALVDHATLKVYENPDSNAHQVNAFRNLENWDTTTVTWNNQPTTTTAPMGSCMTKGTDKNACSIDVTLMARRISMGYANYGMGLKGTDESLQRYVKFYGSRTTSTSYRPRLSVVYYKDGDLVGDVLPTSNTYSKNSEPFKVDWGYHAPKAIDSVQYKLVDTSTNKAVNPAKAYEDISHVVSSGSVKVNIPTGTLKDGKYKIYVKGALYNGETVTASVDNLRIDNTKPVISVCDVVPDGEGAKITWKVSDLNFKEVVIESDANTANKLVASSLKSGSYNISAKNLSQLSSITNITLTAYDKAGHTAQKTVKFSTDQTAPVVASASIYKAGSTTTNGWIDIAQPMILLTGVKDDRAIPDANISYAIAGRNEGRPDDFNYVKPEIISSTSVSSVEKVFAFYVNETQKNSGRYVIYVKVVDEAGNATITPIDYNLDLEAPDGKIITKNALESTESSTLHGVVNITGSVNTDSGSPLASNAMELWKMENGESVKVKGIYNNAAGSSAGSMSKELDTTAENTPNGEYLLKMFLEDTAGYTKTITKNITIANKIDKPVLTAKSTNKGSAKISWTMPETVSSIKRIQYKVEGVTDSKWIDVPDSATLNGTFTATLPDAEGKYKVSVRAIDAANLEGNEAAISVRVDKTLPKAEITSSLQGIIKGTVTDDEFEGWKIFIKGKDGEEDSYQLVLEGNDQKSNELFGDLLLSDSKYAGDTWYTVKLEAKDASGNIQTVTKDIYKNSKYPVAEIVKPQFRIERPEYQGYTVPQIVLSDAAKELGLTANILRTFTLGSADWYVDNERVETDKELLGLKKEDGSSKYAEDTPYQVVAVTKGVLGGTYYSNALAKNGEIKEVTFDQGQEIQLTFEDSVSFTLYGPEENCTYYAKLSGGEYVQVDPNKTYEMLELDENKLDADSLTIKAEPSEGTMPADVIIGLDQLEKETFEISGIESYRPEHLSASDKINYKTYLKWDIPEEIPEDISYEVYRSTDKGFDPQLTDPVQEVRAGHYVETNVDHKTTFYYRVRAIKKDAEGKVIARSSFSDQATSTVIDRDEFLKRLGYKEYWNYADFTLPMGSGYVEKSQGNFMYEQTDAELANEQMGVELTRTYNSRATSKSAFGVGWNHKYDIELLTTEYSDKLEEGEKIVMKDSSGTMFFFVKEPNGSGEYISSMGKYLKLRKLSDAEKKISVELPDRTAGTDSGKIKKEIEATYAVDTKDNLSYYFNAGGQLVYVSEANGNFLVFDHDIHSGLLTKIITSKNLSMALTYNSQPGTDPTTVKKVTLPDGSSMEYGYADGKLTSATKKGKGGATGVTYNYAYSSDRHLKSIDDGQGNLYTVDYAAGGKTVKTEYPDGQSINFNYIADGEETKTTVEKDGKLLNEETATFDTASGNCLKVIDSNGLVTTFEYRDNLLAKTTSETEYEAVKDGVISREVATHTTTTEYNDNENATTEESGFEQWTENSSYTYGNSGEYTEDMPSNETTTIDGDITSDIDYFYDDYGNLTSEFDDITDIFTEYDYYTEDEADADSDIYGEIESESESLNGVIQSTTTYAYNYDTAGNKTVTTTETAGTTTTITVSKYDVLGNELETTTTVNGVMKNQSSNTYDGFSRVIKSVTTEGNLTTTVSTSYTAAGTVASETTTTTDGTKSDTKTVTYEYDNMNRVTSQTTVADGKSRPETTTYAYGTIARNPVLGDTDTVYAKITTTISGSVATKTFEDPKGNIIREDADGISTYHSYDRSGNKISSIAVGKDENANDAIITAYATDQNGNLTHTMTDVAYDGETKAFKSGANTITNTTVYDKQNRAEKTIDGKGIVTKVNYDQQGRTTEIIQDEDGSNNSTKIEYGSPTAGNNNTWTQVTLANGSKTKSTVDVQGQTIQESDIGNGMSIDKNYEFAPTGSVTKQTDSAGNYRTYEYDQADRQSAINFFDKTGKQTLRTEYVYDAMGNVTAMKDYKYDSGSKALYRFTEKRYDGFGKVISEAEVDCTGSEPTEGQLAAARITYTYDNDDRLLTATYASAFDSKVSRLEYVYGEYGRLQKIEAVTTSSTKTLREYDYDGKGNVISIKDNRTALGGTGYALKTYGYDRLNRATSITVTDSEKTGTAEEYTYAYDKNNHIVKETKVNNYPADANKVNEVWNYEYDALERLISTEVYDKGSDEAKSTTAYTYDGAGNRLSETKDEVTVENTYNGLNQMVTSGDSSYNYDSNGNLIKETDSGQDLVKTYSYDADNRLSEAVFTKEGTQTLSQKNIYNGDGQRISKTDNNVTTKYSYQGGSAVYTDGCNENQSLNIMGEAGNIIASERSTGNYFYNKDMRASTTTILDSSGNAKVSYEYTDFGETTAKGDFYNEICYTGGIYDDTTGLYYLNARYYDPDDGRFVTQDTYRGDMNDPGSLHLYAYCANNPVNYVDPSGHDAIILKSNFATRLIGHMAILVKSGSRWKYFSWDNKGYKSKYHGTNVNENGYTSVKGQQVYYDLNRKYKRTASATKYRKYIYIKGNFEGSYEYIKKVTRGESYKKYNLVTVNCSWMALEAFQHGSISKSRKNAIESMQWQWIRGPFGVKVKAMRTVVPSLAFETLKKMFSASVKSVK